MTTWFRTAADTAINPTMISKIDVEASTKTMRLWNRDGDTVLASMVFDTLELAQNWVKCRAGTLSSKTWLRVDQTTAVNVAFVSKLDVDGTTLRFWRADGSATLAEKTFASAGELQTWTKARVVMFKHGDFAPPPEE